MATLRHAIPTDWSVITRLLENAGLPTADLTPDLTGFVVSEDGAGAACVEDLGGIGLLRSVVVDPGRRGTGLGAALVNRAVDNARRLNLGALYLLTTDAAGYFETHGFTAIVRTQGPVALRATREFSELCPDSAVVMRLDL